MPLPILVFSQQELIDELAAGRALPDHLISIGNPKLTWSPRWILDRGMPPVFRNHFRRVLRLEMYDVDRRDQAGSIRPFIVPELRHARAVLRFWARTHRSASGYVIHCHAGISRSTAVAQALLYKEWGNETASLANLLEIRPQASPNRLLVHHFDTLLGSSLMTQAVRLHEHRLEETKKWFYGEIEELLEDLEPAD